MSCAFVTRQQAQAKMTSYLSRQSGSVSSPALTGSERLAVTVSGSRPPMKISGSIQLTRQSYSSLGLALGQDSA